MSHPVRAHRPWTASPHRARTRPLTRRSAVDETGAHCHCSSHPDEARAMTIELRQDRRRPLVSVHGELDLAGAGLLTAMVEHVRREGRGGAEPVEAPVDLDLSGVTFADSCGLAPVLDDRTRVVAASVPVRRVLGLLTLLPEATAAEPADLPR